MSAASPSELERAEAIASFRRSALTAVRFAAESALSERDPARRREGLERIVKITESGMAEPTPKQIAEILRVSESQREMERLAREKFEREQADRPALEHVPRPGPRRPAPVF